MAVFKTFLITTLVLLALALAQDVANPAADMDSFMAQVDSTAPDTSAAIGDISPGDAEPSLASAAAASDDDEAEVAALSETTDNENAASESAVGDSMVAANPVFEALQDVDQDDSSVEVDEDAQADDEAAFTVLADGLFGSDDDIVDETGAEEADAEDEVEDEVEDAVEDEEDEDTVDDDEGEDFEVLADDDPDSGDDSDNAEVSVEDAGSSDAAASDSAEADEDDGADDTPFVTLGAEESHEERFRVLQAQVDPANSPSGHGGIQKVDPNTALTPTRPATFASFDNAKPQNDGLCLEALNNERKAAGLTALVSNSTLVSLAAKHTAYMAATQVASHDGFWSYRFDAVPAGAGGVGEVVVADDLLNAPNGPAKRAVDRWMQSIEHKTLLMRPDMAYVGCSTADGADGKFYATAMVVSN